MWGFNIVTLAWLLFCRWFGDLCACFACWISRDSDDVNRVSIAVSNLFRLQCVEQSRTPGRRQTSKLPRVQGKCTHSGFWLGVFLILQVLRFGEASHPGPGYQNDWHFGIFNPSGLCSKTDQVAHMPGEVWVASETHLTKSGVVKLRAGLRSLKSPYRYIVPGHPCEQRSSDDVGVYSGVALISAHPSRPLPNDFCQESFSTGRIQIAGVQVSGQWVQVGMLYGLAKGRTHHQALFQTEVLLEQLVDRVGCQTTGPRIVCGDFILRKIACTKLKG